MEKTGAQETSLLYANLFTSVTYTIVLFRANHGQASVPGLHAEETPVFMDIKCGIKIPSDLGFMQES